MARRLFIPSLADCFFCALALWLIFFTIADGDLGLLHDTNLGYHIRTGDYVLDTKTVPHSDIFSFTRYGDKWYAMEWLSGALFAAIHRTMGLKGLIVVGAALIGLLNIVTLRHMLRRGTNFVIAMLLLHAGVAASSVHYLTRPHLFTLVFLALGLWLLDRDREKPSRAVWALIPLTIVWVNLHGGFLAILVCLGIMAVGSVLEGEVSRAKRYALLLFACLAASVVNPFGVELHIHELNFLRQRWIVDLVEEYQPPKFGTSSALYFEVLLVAGAGLAAYLLSRKRIVDALLVLAWAHAALSSVRHVPIYFIVLAPILAAEATALWTYAMGQARPGSLAAILAKIADDFTPSLKRMSVWPAVFVLALFLFDFGVSWPKDFPAARNPVALIGRHSRLIATSRIFTTDAWADYLTYHFYPEQRIFLDGRSDFFGREMSEQYLTLLRGHAGWNQLLDQYKLNVVLTPSPSALAQLLRLQPSWKRIEDDGFAALFERVPPQ